MWRSGITWTAETLDAFIADPQMVVPANRMAYAGLMDAAERADLIAYLPKATESLPAVGRPPMVPVGFQALTDRAALLTAPVSPSAKAMRRA